MLNEAQIFEGDQGTPELFLQLEPPARYELTN